MEQELCKLYEIMEQQRKKIDDLNLEITFLRKIFYLDTHQLREMIDALTGNVDSLLETCKKEHGNLVKVSNQEGEQ